MQNLKPLPIGIQTFEDIIHRQFFYVDKTSLVYQLITLGKHYFLSRPRRFGKSLLLSTLDAVFRGKKELFKDLAIATMDYSWEEYPVIRLDISRTSCENEEKLRQSISTLLIELAAAYDVTLEETAITFMLSNFILALYKNTGRKVVVLIDEYDSPLVNQLHDSAMVQKLREILREFYRITKSMDEYLQFVFVTGVSNFAKASMFSGLNHLHNISLAPGYTDICGYTQEEIELYFAGYLEALSVELNRPKQKLLAEIKDWYNGYHFSRNLLPVYNPFSILQFFADKQFANYWYQTGTPSFLVRMIQDTVEPQPPEFDHLTAFQEEFDTLVIENPQSLPLLFQTGYLTIKKYDQATNIYELNYPNKEVKQSFLRSLLASYSGNAHSSSHLHKLSESIKNNDIDIFMGTTKVFFSGIPYDIHISKESYYQTIFYLILKLLGYYIHVEVRTHTGRIDAVLETSKAIYVMEFKLNGTAEAALNQIENKEYITPYLQKNKDLFLVGIEFDVSARSIHEWKVKQGNKSKS